ncbi:MAG: 23S rRNA (guanosine(2251)-2'-O)-methyltransferase RlmB [Smithella sp.]
MDIIYGINPIKTLLQQQQTELEKVIIAAGRSGPSLTEIIKAVRQKNIPLEFKTRKYLDELVGNPDHQGVAGLCKPFVYSDLEKLLVNRSPKSNFDLILILDSIMDPQNLGAIIRTSYCMGANGVIIPTDRAASVTASVIKASAGSTGQLPITRVINLSQTIDYLKEKGFWIFGSDAHENGKLKEMDFNCNVVLILGSEAKGIRPLVKKKCDFLFSIPTQRNFDSLNVSVAAGIIEYEISSMRGLKN